MKILITGGSGLLALNWACATRERHTVVLGTHSRPVRLAGTRTVPLPLDDPGRLLESVRALAPQVIVHTAGLTSVDACELDPAGAMRVNADLSRNVAEAAARVDARLVHVSTDHLFAGTRSFYREDEAAEPLNAYARSKLAAEALVTAACPAALIVRTNFFGWGHAGRQSFSDWIYYNLAAGKALTLFDDVFVTPVLADALASASHRLLELGATGIYNVAGDERVSKHAFAVALAALYGLPESLIQRGKIAASKLSARRPHDMSLDNRKACERLGTSLGTLSDHLGALQQQDRAGRRGELAAAIQE